MDRWKAEQGRGREKRKIRREKIRERVRRKKMQMREKVGKSRNTVFFQWFVAPAGRKVGSLKRRVRSHLARREMKNYTLLWREAHFQVKMYKTHHARTTFGSCDVKKCARRCGAKHISKSTCTKHTILGPLLEVEMSKKCTPLWREAHFEVKMYKTPHVRATFGGSDVEKVHAVVAQSTFWSQNVQNTTCSRHFWRFRCRKSAHRCGGSTFRSQHVKTTRGLDHFWRFRCRFASLNYTTLHYTTLHSTTLHYITPHYTPQHYNYNYTTTLHYTKLHYTLHCATLHYTTLHYTTLPSSTLHYITLHYTPLQLQLHNYTPLHYTTFHYTTLHDTTLHYTTLHYTTLHYNYNYNYTTTLHYTPLHYSTLHYTTLHYTTLHK